MEETPSDAALREASRAITHTDEQQRLAARARDLPIPPGYGRGVRVVGWTVFAAGVGFGLYCLAIGRIIDGVFGIALMLWGMLDTMTRADMWRQPRWPKTGRRRRVGVRDE